MKKIDFITGSVKKFAEIAHILTEVSLEQVKIDLTEIQEVDPHVIMLSKIQEAFNHRMEGNFIIEDTSFYLEAIPGLPGPLIKWFLETIGVEGLVDIAVRHGNTKARVKTIIGYATSEKDIRYFEGEVVGNVTAPRTESGFGFDLIFVPEGHSKTFSEMSEEEKGALSHRGKATRKLNEFLKEAK